jgi:hypothetical protein
MSIVRLRRKSPGGPESAFRDCEETAGQEFIDSPIYGEWRGDIAKPHETAERISINSSLEGFVRAKYF